MTQFEIGRTVGKGGVELALGAIMNALEFNGQEVYKQARPAIRFLKGLGEFKRRKKGGPNEHPYPFITG